jgi:lipid-A-disaccharide synthase
MSDTVMIIAGEASGELYGALLAHELKKIRSTVHIIGIGGVRMKEAGVELISGITSSFGLTEVLSSLREMRKSFKRASDALRRFRPTVLVLIDYPEFNLRLAREAKKQGIQILYYVSPQVWAWRRKRIRTIAQRVDRMAVILPFEEDLYKNVHLNAEFVGHPVFDEIQNMQKDKGMCKKDLGINEDEPLLSLLPGSRPNEIKKLLPVIVEVIREFRKTHKDYRFCVPFAHNTNLKAYAAVIADLEQEGVIINKGKALGVLSVSDAAVIASGTAVLQAAFLGVPIVVIYKLFPLTYWIGKMMVTVRHISLVNILSGRTVIRELIQNDVTTDHIMNELRKIIEQKHYRESILQAYDALQNQFSGMHASRRTAQIVAEMAGWSMKR